MKSSYDITMKIISLTISLLFITINLFTDQYGSILQNMDNK